MKSVFVGFDERWVDAYAVARATVQKHAPGVPVSGVVLPRLRQAGLYWRHTVKKVDEKTGAVQLWDTISDNTMATEFAISRFLTPILAASGWALFMDCDMLVRKDLGALFDQVIEEHADKALVCVKHDFDPVERTKMDGQAQARYRRKNWSSFVFFNVDHPANRRLTVDLVNEVPGRDLHRFCWIDDESLIGELPAEWNFLVGHTDPALAPANVHFTDGIPSLPGYEGVPYADDWRGALYDWAEGAISPTG